MLWKSHVVATICVKPWVVQTDTAKELHYTKLSSSLAEEEIVLRREAFAEASAVEAVGGPRLQSLCLQNLL